MSQVEDRILSAIYIIWLIHYESGWGPYTFRYLHDMTHSLWVYSKTVYFPSRTVYFHKEPYTFRKGPYTFRKGPYRFRERPYRFRKRPYSLRRDSILSGQDRILSVRTVYFPRPYTFKDRILYFSGPYTLQPNHSNWRIFLDCSPTSPRWNRIWGYQMYCSWQWRQSVWHYFRQLSKSNRPRIPDQWKPSVINFWNGISNIHFQLKHCIGNRLVSFLWYNSLHRRNVPRKYLLEIKYISIKCHFLTRAITWIFTKGFIC